MVTTTGRARRPALWRGVARWLAVRDYWKEQRRRLLRNYSGDDEKYTNTFSVRVRERTRTVVCGVLDYCGRRRTPSRRDVFSYLQQLTLYLKFQYIFASLRPDARTNFGRRRLEAES